MGSDKGLLIAPDKNSPQTWTARAGEILNSVGLISKIFYSVNSKQEVHYQNTHKDIIELSSFIVDSNEIFCQGPLRGIFSAHKKLPTKDWLVLAVDMINMRPEILAQLFTKYKEFGSNYDVYCYRTQEDQPRIQPLAAIYSASFLKKIYAENVAQLNESNFKQRGPTCYIEHANAYYIDFDRGVHDSFRNVNSLEDLDGF